MSRARWLPDPVGRHAYRYWDGEAWTATVADDGEEAADPLGDDAPERPSRWRGLLPSIAGVVAAAAVVGIVVLTVILTRTTVRGTGTFTLKFTDEGAYQVHRVRLEAGDTLHAKVLVAGGTVRLGLGLPTKVLEAQPGFPLTVLAARRHNGAAALLDSSGNADLDRALDALQPEGTVAFPGFAGWVAPNRAVVTNAGAGSLLPGSLQPYTATVSGVYDLIVIGERPGVDALLNVHVTKDADALDLGKLGNVVAPDQPRTVPGAFQDLLRDGGAPLSARPATG